MRARVAMAVGAALLLAGAAHARTVTLRWRWSDPTPERRLAGFKVYTRHVDQPFGPPRDVGLPAVQDGVYRVAVELSDTDATYVAVSAYDANGLESPLSEERLFLLPVPGEPESGTAAAPATPSARSGSTR